MRFFLTSTERPWSFGPLNCEVVSQESNSIRNDLAVVRVTPPIPAYEYDTTADLDVLVLASKHAGRSIFGLREWPLTVYICAMPRDDSPDFDKMTVLEWGEIHETEEAALKSQEHWQSSRGRN